MGLGSGSRDRVIVELGLEERPGARVLSGSRASTHLQCLGQACVAGRANNQSYYFGTWVQMGSWGQQKSSGRVLAMSNQYACGLPVVSILFFVDVSTRGQSGKEDGLLRVWACQGLAVLAKLPVEKC